MIHKSTSQATLRISMLIHVTCSESRWNPDGVDPIKRGLCHLGGAAS